MFLPKVMTVRSLVYMFPDYLLGIECVYVQNIFELLLYWYIFIHQFKQ